jgi:hypothetical protein
MDPRMKPGSDGSRPNSVLRRRRSRRLTNGRPASPGCARFLFSSCFLLLSRASPADPIAAASARFLFSSCSLRENQRRPVVSGVLIFFCYLQERRPWNASSRTRGIFPAYSRNGRGRERNTSQRRILAKRSQPRATSYFRMTARGRGNVVAAHALPQTCCATSTIRASFARSTSSVTVTCSAALVANPHCGLKPSCSSLT